LLIATLRDDVVLDVEIEILENGFATINNDVHLFLTEFIRPRKNSRQILLMFCIEILTFLLPKIFLLFINLKSQRKLASKVAEKCSKTKCFLAENFELYVLTLL
jgi:hypothetical protein